MSIGSRLHNSIPKEVSLNPYFDTVSLKMKDLFLKFLAEPTRQTLLQGLIESAATGALQSKNFPSPLQTDPLPSFNNPSKSNKNAPPVRKRSEKHPLMSYTIGPRTRDNETMVKQSEFTPYPTLMSTIDTNRPNNNIPQIKDLLIICLESNQKLGKEDNFNNMLASTPIREITSVVSDAPALVSTERICRDIFGINQYYARTLERKLIFIKSQNGKS